MNRCGLGWKGGAGHNLQEHWRCCFTPIHKPSVTWLLGATEGLERGRHWALGTGQKGVLRVARSPASAGISVYYAQGGNVWPGGGGY